MAYLKDNINRTVRTDTHAAINVVFLFSFFIILGNLIEFRRHHHQINLLSPSVKTNIKFYGNSDLQYIRILCNKDSRLKMISTCTIQ